MNRLIFIRFAAMVVLSAEFAGGGETLRVGGTEFVYRDGSDYLNEPAIGGGNPVASGGEAYSGPKMRQSRPGSAFATASVLGSKVDAKRSSSL